jgi:hypothetical protein
LDSTVEAATPLIYAALNGCSSMDTASRYLVDPLVLKYRETYLVPYLNSNAPGAAIGEFTPVISPLIDCQSVVATDASDPKTYVLVDPLVEFPTFVPAANVSGTGCTNVNSQ